MQTKRICGTIGFDIRSRREGRGPDDCPPKPGNRSHLQKGPVRFMKNTVQDYAYPENLVRDLGVRLICGTEEYAPLTEEQLERLEAAVSRIEPHKHRTLLALRYRERLSYQSVAEKMGLATKDLARRFTDIALKRVREQYGIPYRKTAPKGK